MSHIHAHSTSQRGFTLPELLISMTVSLLVMAAATSAYGTSQRTWLAMAAADAVHANARIALRNIREQAQMAGGAYLQASSTEARFSVVVSASDDLTSAALAGVNGNKSVESLTLSHWHALEGVDCQGNSSSTHSAVRSDYKLNTHKELTCKDLNLPNSTYQALAEGIEDFQVRYAQANPAAQTLQWTTANQVSDMSQVMAIEVCVVVASIATVHNSKPGVSQLGCSGEALVADGRVRRSFKRAMVLRNRASVLP